MWLFNRMVAFMALLCELFQVTPETIQAHRPKPQRPQPDNVMRIYRFGR